MGRWDDAPPELKQKLPHDVRLYMRNAWRHPNDPTRPYDFYTDQGPPEEGDEDSESGEYLEYLAHDDGPLVPANWGDIVILNFARGCLKTTTATAVADWGISEYPMIEFDITAPRQEQFSEVMDRFKEAAKNSGIHQFRTKNNISHQKFERQLEKNNGEKIPVSADVKARSAWGDGDALRGLHGHGGVIDEFQDVDEGMFSTFLEAVDQSVPQVPYFPTIFVIGTPKMSNSFFDQLWQMSDQKTWDGDGGEWIQQEEPDEFIPQELAEQRAELREEADELETLRGNDEVDQDALEAEIQSKREAADAIEGYNVTGWHIDQYESPLHDNAKIEFKRQKYTEKKFKNEVLAQFYTPENDLLSDEHVKDMMDDSESFTNKRIYEDSTVVVGVDWGGGSGQDASDTVIVVAEKIPLDDGEYRMPIRAVEFLDPDLNKQDELDKVEQYIRDFEADRIAVDEGYGAKQREDLQNGNNLWNDGGYDNVCGIIYGNIKDKDEPKFSNSSFDDSAFCTVARTHMIESMVADFKDGRFEIPSATLDGGRDSKRQKLIDHLTAPYTDRVETSDGKKKLKVLADRNDDAFQAFVYAWIAANKFGSRRTLKRIGSHNKAGY
ncbi:hypothetical protein HAPG_00102 [Halorubrum phage GNf2]|nr:hypothetical protein HAPG_00102 [Halorubrum phage GNf2]